MKNKPNLDLYPFNKKVSLDLPYEEDIFRTKKKKVSQQELESLNLSTLEKSFFEEGIAEYTGRVYQFFPVQNKLLW